MTYTKIIPFLLASLLIASSAKSQTDDWATVQGLRSGTKIKVTLKNRPTFGHCFFDGASDDQLFCTSRGGLLRSEEHTSELQSHLNLVCRLLLEKKKKKANTLKSSKS